MSAESIATIAAVVLAALGQSAVVIWRFGRIDLRVGDHEQRLNKVEGEQSRHAFQIIKLGGNL